MLILPFAGGCAARAPKVEPWQPLARVGWNDLSIGQSIPASRGHQILSSASTKGLFPASLAVTRLAATETPDAEAHRLTLMSDPRNEFLQWNSALDDKMAISEVFPISARDLGGNEAKPTQILAAFRALDARLGLIYAVNELSADETEILGVLYDVKQDSPIATIHAHAHSVPPSETGTRRRPVDLWKTDSRALVRADFEGSFRECVRALIAKDEPPIIETPDGWRPAQPSRPVDWPPRSAKATPQ